MTSPAPHDADGPRPRGRTRREVGWWLRTLVLMFLVFVVGVAAAGAGMSRVEQRGWSGALGGFDSVLSMLVAVGAMAMPLLLLLRRRDLSNTAWGLGFLQLLLPVGPVMAAVLPQAIRRDRSDEAGALSFLYVVGLAVWFARDVVGRTGESSMVRMIVNPVGTPPAAHVELNLFAVAVTFALMAIPPIAGGYLWRARAELDDTRQALTTTQSELTDTRSEAVAQRTAVGEMSAQLSRQAERDLIAREVHDVIGHRLSLLTLHAGGLELAADGDPELRESARYVRENAQQAMDDLRSLIGVLREPASASSRQGALAPVAMSLADLPRVIDEMAETGSPVASTVFLTDAEKADPMVAHSVFRIVQELLTNARKHAPGALLRLRVAGGPSAGITIEASNPAEDGRPGDGHREDAHLGDAHLGDAHLGDGHLGAGLVGIGERVALLGGNLELPVEEGRFSVRVHLPWTVAQPDDGAASMAVLP